MARRRNAKRRTGLVIVKDQASKARLRGLLSKVFEPKIRLEYLWRDYVVSERQLRQILNEGYSFVVLPLTLRYFLSVRLAELAHHGNIPTRLILVSQTNASKSVLLKLFDAYIHPDQLSTATLRKAFLGRTVRRTNRRSVESAIEAILNAADCFAVEPELDIPPNKVRLRQYEYSLIALTHHHRFLNQERALHPMILFLSADPLDAARLRVTQEHREIQCALALPGARHFVLEARFALRVRDFTQAILTLAPAIVHFSGHGNVNGDLCFEDEGGLLKPVRGTDIASMLKFNRQVQCVVLNACYSEKQANEILKHVPYVIGVKSSVEDKVAVAFSSHFYTALAKGRKLEEAFEFSSAALRAEYPSRSGPVLLMGRKKFDHSSASESSLFR